VIAVSVLVVFESMFGNTAQIAEAVAGGLAGAGAPGVAVVAVDETPRKPPDDVDLVVVGGPTHAFGMTRPRTRQDAAARPGAVSTGRTGIREGLDGVEMPRAGIPSATLAARMGRRAAPAPAADAGEPGE
jgi:hypothetical protein